MSNVKPLTKTERLEFGDFPNSPDKEILLRYEATVAVLIRSLNSLVGPIVGGDQQQLSSNISEDMYTTMLESMKAFDTAVSILGQLGELHENNSSFPSEAPTRWSN